jgi:hypothetical protein
MADSDESEIDDDEFIKIFEDSDDENEFECFGPEDLIPDYEILREIDLQQSLRIEMFNKMTTSVVFEMILHRYVHHLPQCQG